MVDNLSNCPPVLSSGFEITGRPPPSSGSLVHLIGQGWITCPFCPNKSHNKHAIFSPSDLCTLLIEEWRSQRCLCGFSVPRRSSPLSSLFLTSFSRSVLFLLNPVLSRPGPLFFLVLLFPRFCGLSAEYWFPLPLSMWLPSCIADSPFFWPSTGEFT